MKYLVCPDCDFRERSDLPAKIRRLNAIGMLLRDRQPAAELVDELFTSSLERLSCPECGGGNLKLQQHDDPDDDDAWDDVRRCQSCNQPIARERLEALPEAVLCAACRQAEECGRLAGPDDYCPFCGAVMQLKLASGQSARYVSYCPECRR